MAEERRRISLIVQWIEQYPERVKAVEGRVKELVAGYNKAKAALVPYAKSQADLTKLNKILEERFEKYGVQILKGDWGVRLYTETLEQFHGRGERLSKSLGDWATSFRRLGFRVGFFGWILTYTLRNAIHVGMQFVGALQKVIMSGVNWVSNIDTIATAIALLQARGYTTAEAQDVLTEGFGRLIDVGPKVESLWKGIEGMLLSVMAIILEEALPYLEQLYYWLAEMLADPKTQQWIRDLARMIFSNLIPAFIRAWPAIKNVIDTFIAWLPTILDVIAALLPLLPYLLGLGVVAWGLGTVLSGLSGIFSVLSGVVGFLSGTFGICSTAAGGLGIAIGSTTIALGPFLLIILAIVAAVAAIILIWQNWDAIVRAFTPVIDALRPIGEALLRLFQAVGRVLFEVGNIFFQLGRIVFELIRLALEPLKPILEPIYNFLKLIGEVIYNLVLGAVKGLTDALNGLADMLGGVGDFLGGIADALGGLCFKHAALDVGKFSDSLVRANVEMGRTLGDLGEMKRGLEELEATPLAVTARERGGGVVAPGPSTQYVEVYAPITIGNITAEVDLDAVTAAVDRGIASGVRRVK